MTTTLAPLFTRKLIVGGEVIGCGDEFRLEGPPASERITGPVARLVRREAERGTGFWPVLRVGAHPREDHRDDGAKDALVRSRGVTQVLWEGARPHELRDVVDTPAGFVDGAAVVTDQASLDEGVRSAVPCEHLVDDRSQCNSGLGSPVEGVCVGRSNTGVFEPILEHIGSGVRCARGD
ncbi:MAG TPA: hypothetical protein PKA99_10880 [Dermatophilaceae bacterium]|nr:hypothetical protein [Dermatophilaceae bacterium]